MRGGRVLEGKGREVRGRKETKPQVLKGEKENRRSGEGKKMAGEGRKQKEEKYKLQRD